MDIRRMHIITPLEMENLARHLRAWQYLKHI